MQAGVIYDHRYFDNNLGDVWNAVGAIGAAGVQMLPTLLNNQGSAAGGPARGLAAIQAAVQQALSSLNQLLAAVRQGQIPPQQAVTEASRIANALSDPQYVYQAQRGNDANALNAGKQQAAALVQQIQQAAGASVPATTTGGITTTTGTSPLPANVQPTANMPTTATPNGGGFDGSTLLLLGGGLVGLLLLTR